MYPKIVTSEGLCNESHYDVVDVSLSWSAWFYNDEEMKFEESQAKKEMLWKFLLPDVSLSLEIVDGFVLNWDGRKVRHCSISMSRSREKSGGDQGGDKGWVKDPKMQALFTCHGNVGKKVEEIEACAILAHSKEERTCNTLDDWKEHFPKIEGGKTLRGGGASVKIMLREQRTKGNKGTKKRGSRGGKKKTNHLSRGTKAKVIPIYNGTVHSGRRKDGKDFITVVDSGCRQFRVGLQDVWLKKDVEKVVVKAKAKKQDKDGGEGG